MTRIEYLKNRAKGYVPYEPEWIDGAYPELLTTDEIKVWDRKFANTKVTKQGDHR